MRYLVFAVIPFAMVILISCTFAQSSETEALEARWKMLENELKEIKDLLSSRLQKTFKKKKGNGFVKEEVQKRDVKITAEESPASVKEPVIKEAIGEESYLAGRVQNCPKRNLLLLLVEYIQTIFEEVWKKYLSERLYGLWYRAK